jgi:hypothetical protein
MVCVNEGPCAITIIKTNGSTYSWVFDKRYVNDVIKSAARFCRDKDLCFNRSDLAHVIVAAQRIYNREVYDDDDEDTGIIG